MQPALFDHDVPRLDQAYARRTDPITSKESAQRVTASVSELQQLVLAALRKFGPGTTEEIARWTAKSLVTISPRLKPLEAKGAVIRSGKKVNQSGHAATVWKVVS